MAHTYTHRLDDSFKPKTVHLRSFKSARSLLCADARY